MFGCVVAGRPLQTNLQQIDDTHAIFELPSASTINHICVFLLGTVPFPDGLGATVHFHWPGKGFQLLGALSNDKPSAIFRLRGTFSAQSSLTHAAFQGSNIAGGGPINTDDDVTAVLGLSIEPLTDIQTQLSLLVSTGSVIAPTPDATALAEKMAKHLLNYLSGFTADAGGGVTPESFVQLRTVTRWYQSFITKIKAGGVSFLDNQE